MAGRFVSLVLAVLVSSALGQIPQPASEATPEAAEAHRREEEILRRSDQEIEKHRKTEVTIRLVDAAGKPVAGVPLKVEQTQHEFLFGCNLFAFGSFKTPAENAEYGRRFEAMFNYATLPFYWGSLEPQRGQPQYEALDKMVLWCRERGIRCKGHPLLSNVPPWSREVPSPAEQKAHVVEVMRRYQGKVQTWEVINEPVHLPEWRRLADPYRWAREADPQAYLTVNEYLVLADGCPAYYRLLQQAIGEGVPLDGIGIQAHEPRTMRFPLDLVWEVLDQYATLGKELHITEFTPPSAGQEITGSHRKGHWFEAEQAEYAAKFYRIAFGHPAVAAISWWDFCDRGATQPGGGMLRADLSPKPVYEALYDLIHRQWKTRAEGKTDLSGVFAFRGFLGSYRLVLDHQGQRHQGTFHLRKAGSGTFTITLPSARP